jgi:NhaP-type Na+/H+ or K+/H+ antiporter
MLTGLAFLFLLGMALGWLCQQINLPRLLGMLVTGMLLGSYALNLLSDKLLFISADLRQLALIIILLRAGLSLDVEDLKRIGRPAFLMCFIPASCEILGMVLIAPKLLGISILDAAIMGAVVAAVSPAVVVPKMLYLMEHRFGTNKGIPQMIMAGASVDDVFVIVLFTAFIGLSQGETISAFRLLEVPASLITGLFVGTILGIASSFFFKKFHIRDSAKVIILLSISFMLVALEHLLKGSVPFSGLLAVMSIGAALLRYYEILAKRLSEKFSKLWVGAEVMLFVLVGATVDMKYAMSAGLGVIALILLVLIFRMLGVYCCLLKTKLSMKERLFCMIAFIPKATVQAAIGSIPLSLGLPCGNIVLTVAVLSILITAPLGALGVDITYKRLLLQESEGQINEKNFDTH